MHQSTVPIVPRTLAAGGMDSCAGIFAILGLLLDYRYLLILLSDCACRVEPIGEQTLWLEKVRSSLLCGWLVGGGGEGGVVVVAVTIKTRSDERKGKPLVDI